MCDTRVFSMYHLNIVVYTGYVSQVPRWIIIYSKIVLILKVAHDMYLLKHYKIYSYNNGIDLYKYIAIKI